MPTETRADTAAADSAQQDGNVGETARAQDRAAVPVPRTVVAATLLVLAVYVRTLYPTVPGGDAGELIVEAWTMGTAHPPGYPLFTMLGYLWSHALPIGSVAYRVNALAAVFGAAAAGFLAMAVLETVTGLPEKDGDAVEPRRRDIAVAVAAAMVYAFSPLVWYYSVQGEGV